MTLAVVILAAGKGTRMKSSLPKILHPIGGLPMIGHVLSAATALNPSEIVVVIPPEALEIEAYLQDMASNGVNLKLAIQTQAKGTGDAVKVSLDHIGENIESVLILCGDTPALTGKTLSKLCEFHKNISQPGLALYAMDLQNPASYGRLVVCGQEVTAIVEAAVATPEELTITLCNTGVLIANMPLLKGLLNAVKPNPQSGEVYLTDVVELVHQRGAPAHFILGAEEEFVGVNDRTQLAWAEGVLQTRWRKALMLSGVTLLAPESVYLSFDTVIGQDTVIYPNVFLGAGVKVGQNALIRSFSFLQQCVVEDNVKIGPCAHLRPGATLKSGSRVGNFVEIKNSVLACGSHVDHLSYIGDATVGVNAAIGAGTITCNYNGFEKFPTTIGEGAFVGSHSTLVAPVTIGAQSIVAAGSVITRDVPEDALAFARSSQMVREGYAATFRRRASKRRQKKLGLVKE
ncbi:MAG: bifunctional UDP-N-acetylglucosamine diphosphorylase/glucosamine-1-phosphate N-acetyltransferase GlmU [Alphaproteobacteria bacterium]|nr:bifunctional UDP-N-acetylglucosamine diphosphorylase/glucosamine-1-phosphate N-acetyltransferase GlmU [Alphaproteobacteria bacterium]OJV46987.1 MAG: UDP-N-acetylglucosamine diphosphorylase/glucosamine-1-phosphate N-acetyltransferase [Alphaproteobacteria bacterium 43-37]